MLAEAPEYFSENGARPVQILGRPGRLIGWARSFSDPLTVTDNTIVGGRPQGRLTRIAGRDVSEPDGHTVGKTFCRKALAGPQRKPSSATPAEPTGKDIRRAGTHAGLDPRPPRAHKHPCLQNGARETGLGHWLPGFLRSNQSRSLKRSWVAMPQKE